MSDLDIAVGYVTSDSLMELQKLVVTNAVRKRAIQFMGGKNKLKMQTVN